MASARHGWIASRVAQAFGLDEARVSADLFSAGADADRVAKFLDGNNGLTKIFVHFQPQGNSKDEAKVSEMPASAALRGWAGPAHD